MSVQNRDTVAKVESKMATLGISASAACKKVGIHNTTYYKARKMLRKAGAVEVVDHGTVAAPAAKKPSRPVLTGQRMALVYGSPAEVAEFYRQMARG